MKRFLAILMTVLTVFVAAMPLAACGEEEDSKHNEKVDVTKTQLYVGVYNGGLGTDWAYAVKDAFEAKYANESFESGKTGVQVLIKPDKLGYEPDTLIANIQSGVETSDVYLTASSIYYKFVNGGVCEDISDVLSEKVYGDDGELVDGTGTTSIIDKMDDFFVTKYLWKDGKYYGFPFEDSIQGLIYDEDLFDERGWTVPATMDDFYSLIRRMVNSDVTPFTWTGGNDFYYTCLTNAIVSQYEGLEGVETSKTLSGTISSDNVYYDSEHPENNVITEQTGWKLAGRRGNLEALKFLREISSKSQYYSSLAFGGSQSHLVAQQDFLSSVVKEANTGSGRIAMLLDGEWWENEARAYFGEMSSIDESYGFGKRNFKFLPMPTIEGQKSTNRVVWSFSSGTVGFVSKKSAQKDLAKLWVKFMHSESSLQTFTVYTGSSLGYDYDLTDAQYESLTPFAKSVWDVKHDPEVTIVRAGNTCDLLTFGEMPLGGIGGEIVASEGKKNALRAFYNDRDLTAQEYFEESLNYCSETNWTKAYNKYHGIK